MQSGAIAHPSTQLSGIITAPGDKSISHRAIILGALANGQTEVTGLLRGADILSTIGAMTSLGAKIAENEDGSWTVDGCGDKGLNSPDDIVDCGNAGTGVRLIMGAAAAYRITAKFTGDESLRSRPMARVLDPLRDMGASVKSAKGDRLPLTIASNGELSPVDYTPPHASAQVKSAILLAGLKSEGVTTVREKRLTRDHTENMLRAFGAEVKTRAKDDGQIVSIEGPIALHGTRVNVPGDPSSAAFAIVAALIVPGSSIHIENVMMNPTRTGLFETLAEMGADIRTDNFRKSGGEVIADLHVRHSNLRGVTVPPQRAPSMIDEYPILAVAAAFAKGDTVMNGIDELRVKESDRISATVELLRRNGVDVTESADGMRVRGGAVTGGAKVKSFHDHRIAMSALILGLAAQNPVEIDDASMIATSFPDFFDLMASLGANIETS
ncbi:MAG: 3-phosphoshikimate 1-carboxyvinyltransferase [Hellea sp.]|nr:3-phosphoshikimate 1-carboxyvinyltransferase [Hellea sp.]